MSENAYRAVLTEPGRVRLEPFETPSPDPGQVLIRTSKTLISPGTERALLLNLPGLAVQYPKELGYSHVGTVVEVGSEVSGLAAGDRVASKSRHASHVVAEASRCHKLADDLTDEHATFFQLLATSLQAVRKTRVEIGEAAAVLGAGLVGLLALQVARVAGALPTVAIDTHEGRLSLARQLGADHIFTASTAVDDIETVHEMRNGLPVVIEATGNPTALETACQICAFGGRIALLGSSRGASESFDFYQQVHKRGISLIGAHISSTYRSQQAPGWWTLHDEQRTALKLIKQRRVQVAPMITHRFQSIDIETAYDLLAQWNLETIGIIIDWS